MLTSANPRSPAVADWAHVGLPNLGSKVVKKPKKDPVRENRIHNEAIVDTYGPEEQAMGWYYYLDSNIRFPFQACCMVSRVVSPLRKGENCRSPAHGSGGGLFA